MGIYAIPQQASTGDWPAIVRGGDVDTDGSGVDGGEGCGGGGGNGGGIWNMRGW